MPSVVGNCVNMYMLLKLVTSYSAKKEQGLLSQLMQLWLRWVSIHVATIVTEFMLVVTRGMYDYIVGTNTNKQPESADAYQPSASDLEEIKQYYNGSLKVKIERVKVKVTHSLTCLLTYLLTHSLTYLLTYLLIHSLTHSLTHLPTHSLTYLLTHSLTHTLTHSLTHLLID